MNKFIKRPVVIEAVQFTGTNGDEILSFINQPEKTRITDKGIVIATLEGDHLASIGDWVIKGTKGEFYPCKPDIFQEIYEMVE